MTGSVQALLGSSRTLSKGICSSALGAHDVVWTRAGVREHMSCWCWGARQAEALCAHVSLPSQGPENIVTRGGGGFPGKVGGGRGLGSPDNQQPVLFLAPPPLPPVEDQEAGEEFVPLQAQFSAHLQAATQSHGGGGSQGLAASQSREGPSHPSWSERQRWKGQGPRTSLGCH